MRASTKAWIVTIALTALTAAALSAGLNAAPLGWLAFLAAVTLVKGRLILLDFLELRPAGRWRRGIVTGFSAAILTVAGLLALASF